MSNERNLASEGKIFNPFENDLDRAKDLFLSKVKGDLNLFLSFKISLLVKKTFTQSFQRVLREVGREVNISFKLSEVPKALSEDVRENADEYILTRRDFARLNKSADNPLSVLKGKLLSMGAELTEETVKPFAKQGKEKELLEALKKIDAGGDFEKVASKIRKIIDLVVSSAEAKLDGRKGIFPSDAEEVLRDRLIRARLLKFYDSSLKKLFQQKIRPLIERDNSKAEFLGELSNLAYALADERIPKVLKSLDKRILVEGLISGDEVKKLGLVFLKGLLRQRLSESISYTISSRIEEVAATVTEKQVRDMVKEAISDLFEAHQELIHKLQSEVNSLINVYLKGLETIRGEELSRVEERKKIKALQDKVLGKAAKIRV